MAINAYDPNAILVEPLPDRFKESIVQSYQKMILHVTKRGFKPGIPRLDNEAFNPPQDEMDKHQI